MEPGADLDVDTGATAHAGIEAPSQPTTTGAPMPDHNPVGIESMSYAQIVELVHAQAAEIDRLRGTLATVLSERDAAISDANRDDFRASATIATLTARVRHLTQALASTTAVLTSYL